MPQRTSKARIGLLILIVIALTPVAVFARIGANGETPKPFVISGQLAVQFSEDVRVGSAQNSLGRVSFAEPAITTVLSRYNAMKVEPIFPMRSEDSPNPDDRMMSKFQLVYVPESTDLDLLIQELMQTGKVVTAEKVMAEPLLAPLVPNDTRWPDQYGPTKVGASEAWNYETGSDSVKIAIADSGVNYKHADLKPNIWVNPGEDLDGDGEVYDTDDINGIDDDGNGRVDDLIGYDFFTGFGGMGVWPGEDGGTPDTDPNDFDGHGTHCSGIAAAATNNGIGVAGICGGWNGGTVPYKRGPRIMCLRIGAQADDGLGYVSLANAATAIDYAALNGADVVSCSWGSSSSTALANAINRANDSGVVISKAAGNDNADAADYMGTHPFVVTVASTDGSDIKSSFSNYGSWVEISAPGSGIWSTYSSSYVATYASLSGTSMAAPAFAGCVALVKSLMPGWTKTQIEPQLFNNADDLDALNPTYAGLLGAGRVDVFDATNNLPKALFSGGPSLIGNPGMNVNFTDLSPNSPTSWDWNFGDGGVSTSQNPSHQYNNVGVYTVDLTIDEPNGTGYEFARNMVLVQADTLGGDTGSAALGDELIVPVRLKTDFQVKAITLPFKYSDANGIVLDYIGFSTTGLVSQNWEQQQEVVVNPFGKEVVIVLRPNIGLMTNGHSQYLQPGEHVVVNLRFTLDNSSTPGGTLPITTPTISGNALQVQSIYGTYAPAYVTMGAEVAGCCELAGDANHSNSVNIADVTFLINRIFSGGPAPSCQDEGDANGSNTLNIADVTYLISRIFSGGPAPVCGTTGM